MIDSPIQPQQHTPIPLMDVEHTIEGVIREALLAAKKEALGEDEDMELPDEGRRSSTSSRTCA